MLSVLGVQIVGQDLFLRLDYLEIRNVTAVAFFPKSVLHQQLKITPD